MHPGQKEFIETISSHVFAIEQDIADRGLDGDFESVVIIRHKEKADSHMVFKNWRS